MKIDKSVFLGAGEGPDPVWRDEAEDAESWPEGAAFKLVFTREICGDVAYDFPCTEFYGADGWPVDFPEERKHLSDLVKEDFQVLPRLWRTYHERAWATLERRPDQGRRSRQLGAVLRPMVGLTSKLAPR